MRDAPFDVCIIGAGLAGSLIAHRLTAFGVRVICIEAGPRYDSNELIKKVSTLNSNNSLWSLDQEHPAKIFLDNSSTRPYPLEKICVKGVGGSTLAWLGTALRLHPHDFKMLSMFGIATDWPLDYLKLEPYYLEAEKLMGVAGADDNPWLSR